MFENNGCVILSIWYPFVVTQNQPSKLNHNELRIAVSPCREDIANIKLA